MKQKIERIITNLEASNGALAQMAEAITAQIELIQKLLESRR